MLINHLRHSPDLCGLVSLVLVNPLSSASAHFPAELPFKAALLDVYRQACVSFARLARVLHEGSPPLIDSSVVEFALLAGRRSSAEADFASELQCEVALVCGDHDLSAGRGQYEAIAAKLGCSRPVTFLRGLGACPHLEDPEKFADAVINSNN